MPVEKSSKYIDSGVKLLAFKSWFQAFPRFVTYYDYLTSLIFSAFIIVIGIMFTLNS